MTRRLLITYVTITLIALAGLGLPFGFTFAGRERDRLRSELERDAAGLAALVEDGLEDSRPDEVTAIVSAYRTERGERFVVFDYEGSLIGDSDPGGEQVTADSAGVSEALLGRSTAGSLRSGGRRLAYVAIPVTSGGQLHGAVQLTLPESELDDRSQEVWVLLALAASSVLAVVAIVGLALARSVSRPVRDLEEAARRMATGDLTVRVDASRGAPEIRSLAQTFNVTADRLVSMIDAQQRFVADAAHELRTPLTALRLRLENLEPHVPDPELPKYDAALDEVRRLSRLVDALLALARTEDRAPPLEPVDLTTVVGTRAETWEPVAAEDGVELSCVLSPDLWVQARRGAAEQILDNLVANALGACAEGGTVRLEATARDEGSVELRVVDNGRGMTAEERARAFERFWRGDRRTPGSGLGLPIVERLTVASGGQVRLEPGPDGRGTAAVVVLPRAKEGGAGGAPLR
jgi:signal transduction histidine kinase